MKEYPVCGSPSSSSVLDSLAKVHGHGEIVRGDSVGPISKPAEINLQSVHPTSANTCRGPAHQAGPATRPPTVTLPGTGKLELAFPHVSFPPNPNPRNQVCTELEMESSVLHNRPLFIPITHQFSVASRLPVTSILHRSQKTRQ